MREYFSCTVFSLNCPHLASNTIGSVRLNTRCFNICISKKVLHKVSKSCDSKIMYIHSESKINQHWNKKKNISFQIFEFATIYFY